MASLLPPWQKFPALQCINILVENSQYILEEIIRTITTTGSNAEVSGNDWIMTWQKIYWQNSRG